MLKSIWAWLVYSSADSRKLSLTVKGALTSIIPFVIVAGNLTNLQLQNEDLENVVDGIVLVIEAGLGLVAAITFIYGAIRKVWRTLMGEHLGLNYRG